MSPRTRGLRYLNMKQTHAFVGGLAMLAIALGQAAASAQSLGTFTWQLQPFCNRVTVTVTQNGGIYTLDGYDDQCGAAQRAPLVGLAMPNPDGSIGLGFHIATSPGGKTVSVESRISLATVGGPWSDSAGNSGTLALNGSVAGSARPAPAGGLAWGTVLSGPGGLTGSQRGLTVNLPAPGAGAGGGAVVGVWGEAVTLDPDDRGGVLGMSRTGDGVIGRSESGFGVSGNSASATGVNGFSSSGIGVAGFAGSGTAVVAYSNSGTALDLGNGPILVSGSQNRRPLFFHTTAPGNIAAHVSTLDHPLLNGNPNAAVFVMHQFVPGATVLNPHALGVWYDTGIARWRLFNEDAAAMPAGLRVAVLAINVAP
jgi:hypothetical protein